MSDDAINEFTPSDVSIERNIGSSQSAGWLQRLLPWLVSISIVGWLLWPYRAAEQRVALTEAFAQASHWTLPVALVSTVVIWLTDSYATARTLQRWGTPMTLRETCLIRGATGFFDAVNPTLGQAVLTLVVYRRGTALGKAVLLVLLINIVFVFQIALVSGAGLLAGAAPESTVMKLLVGASLISTAVYLIIVALRPAALARNRTLAWLMEAGVSGHAWAFLDRLPNVIVIIGAQVVFMRCFGIELPWQGALFYLPPLMFIVGIPISVQGLGPGQVASVSFFSAYVAGDQTHAEATILAYGFASAALFTLCTMLLGLCCLGTATGREALAMVRSRARPPEAEV